MDKSQLHKIFSNPFNNSDWLEVLQNVFGAKQLLSQPREILLPSNDKVKAAFELGNFTTSDDRIIGFYLIELNPDVWLERNKVGLRELLRNIYKYDVDGAIIVFDQGEKWRLSFVSEIKVLNDEGEVIEQATEPKRYTYLLGQDKKVKTPSERLSKLAGKTLALNDILEAFSVESLSKEFYDKLYNWYEKAQKKVVFPNDEQVENHSQTSLIRMLTRLLFIWFIKEKKLINVDLFAKDKLQTLIDYEKPSSFYKAILQNLFFATLNRPVTERSFRTTTNGKPNQTNNLATTIYRYQSYFNGLKEADIIALFDQTPFLNGGLFECLDREASDAEKQAYDDDKTIRPIGSAIRIDGFSDGANNELVFHNHLFFNEDEQDLGLIDLFNQYQFTVEESTPLDVEVALDPELLGKVFENLLASYNPETGQQARKATGSFYTPREIVNYMVDESLKQHFHQHTDLTDEQINALFVDAELTKQANALNKQQAKALIYAIDGLKILDPAVGSGAYPMGILQRLVLILEKVDAENIHFKQQQIDKAEQIPDEASCASAIAAIEQVFSQQNQHNNYGKKLMLIENCIYGVDIQPIAIQICKLRFFISLTIEQSPNQDKADNYGIKALPNLETKFIVANSLLPLGEILGYGGLWEKEILELRKQLTAIRHKHFSAKTLTTKRKYRDKDKNLREQMLAELTKSGITTAVEASMRKIVHWDLYNQNAVADWFDPEWQFGVNDGFDIVIGNPPYGFRNVLTKEEKEYFRKIEKIEFRSGDVAELFCKKAFDKLVKQNAVLSFIIPKKCSYGESWNGWRVNYLQKFNLKFILDTGKAFDNVLLEQTAFGLIKNQNQKQIKLSFLDVKIRDINEFAVSQKEEIFKENNTMQIYLKYFPRYLFNKIVNNSQSEKLVTSNLGLGIGTAFFSEEETEYKLLKGIDINKWKVKSHRYLKNKQNLKWESAKKFLKPKVLCQRLIAHIENPKPHIKIAACYDSEGIIITNTITSFKLDPSIAEKFWLAYLNSALIGWFTYNYIYARAIRGMDFYSFYIEQIPIPKITIREQQPFIALVDQILTAKQQGQDTGALETEIDEMVYQLYDLSEEEINIIK